MDTKNKKYTTQRKLLIDEITANNNSKKLLKKRRRKSINLKKEKSDDQHAITKNNCEEIENSTELIDSNIKVTLVPNKIKKTVQFNEEVSYFYQINEHQKHLIYLHKLFREY